MHPIRRSTLSEEVGESLLPEGLPADGNRRTVVVPLLEGVSGMCGSAWRLHRRRRAEMGESATWLKRQQ